MKMNPKEKFKLFKQSKNFCSTPWHLLYIDEQSDVYTCSWGKEKLGSLKTDTIEEIASSKPRLKIQQSTINDCVDDNCTKCMAHEKPEVNYGFIRNMYNKQYVKIYANYHNETFVLGGLDLHWSSTCDLKCITCYAKQSSSIAIEQGIKPNHTPSDVAYKFIDWVIENQRTLQEIYLSGGEPTLIKYNLNLLQRLDKRTDLLIRVNTNMMWQQDNAIIQEILKFPNVLFTCSADDTGDRFNYIRRGASWDKFISNLNYLQSHENVNVRINSVFFVSSATTITNTIDYFYNNHGIRDFTINQCAFGHTYLQCRNLSDNIKQQAKDKLIQALERYSTDFNLVGSFNNCICELDHCKEEDYKDYFEHIDHLEGTDWKLVFKELV